jgi:gas vesicle protein
MKKSGKIALGLAAVLAAGAVIGVLIAPDKGERTRRRLVRKGQELLFNVNHKIAESKDNLEKIKDEVKANLERVSSKLQRNNY